MESIANSGLMVSNAIMRITLIALEEAMGKRGLDTLLNLAHLPQFISTYPESNLGKKIDFSEFSMLNGALEELYGHHGGRSLALCAGRATFQSALGMFGSRAGVESPLFMELPVQQKLLLGLQGIALTFSQTTDQKSVLQQTPEGFLFTIEQCPQCYGRHSETPCCHLTAGLLMAALKWLTGGGEFRVTETRCKAMGDSVCEYTISGEPIS